MKNTNPFIYSDDNKRYHTWNYYLKHRFLSKVYKVPLNAGFTCPNRDGLKSTGGCTFCSAAGSGEFAGKTGEDLLLQYKNGKIMMEKKWPNSLTIPYLQSYTNTYGPLSKVKEAIEPFLNIDEVVAISIATRADCLSDECIEYLNHCSNKKEIWIELGLQSIHEETALLTNRGHTYQEFLNTIKKLENTSIKICVHIMNGLPNETPIMMIETVKALATLPIHAVKIHMLHVIKNTKLAESFPFQLLSQDEYVELVIKQLELLPKNIIIQRLTGDGVLDDLIAPIWTTKKTITLNEIDKKMALYNTWHGKHYEQG